MRLNKEIDMGEYYEKFIKTVIKNGELWTLDNDGDFLVFDDLENGFIPFFINEDEARKAASEGWEDFSPGAFKSDDFINEFVPEIAKTDLQMAVIYDDSKYIALDFVEVRYDMEASHYEIKGELGHPRNKRLYNVDFNSELIQMRMDFTADTEKDFSLIKPDWLSDDDGLKQVFEEQNDLKINGSIVYGTYVMANKALFDEGAESHPCIVIFSMDPYFNSKPFELVSMAWKINSYLNMNEDSVPEELRELVKKMEAEEERIIGMQLPLSLSGGKTVYCTDAIFQRDHLPGGQLYGRLFPVIADSENVKSIMVLPKYYWSDNIIKVFIDDDVPDDTVEAGAEITEKIINEVLGGSKGEKYDYFIKKAVRDEEVWTLRDGDYIVIEDQNGQRWLPLWPGEEFAEKEIKGHLSEAIPVAIDVYEFSVLYTHKFAKSGWKAAVMWNDMEFAGKTFYELKKDLEAEMLNDPSWK